MEHNFSNTFQGITIAPLKKENIEEQIEVEYDETWNDLNIKAILTSSGKQEGKEIAVINNKIFIDKKDKILLY